MDEYKVYKYLYFHAFNALSDLKKEIEDQQAELEELFLDLLESDLEF